MKAIVVDDEILSLESMVRMLQKFDVEVVGAFQDPREALKLQGRGGAQVAFLDIEMPELNGLELAFHLQTVNPELHIVFVTAYEQYAIEAFELDAVDYLLKPLQLKRLDTTVKRLQAIHTPPQADKPVLPTLCLFHHLSFQDSQGGGFDIPWRTTTAKELFAFLINIGDKTPNKEEILDQIWPDVDLDKSVTQLHTTIYQIRQTMKNAKVPLRINYKDGRYGIELAGVQIDFQRWEKAVRETLEHEEHEKLLELLLNGYRGDYLEKEGYLWAENERERLRTLWLELALRNVNQLEVADLFSSAISLYQQLQTRFPEIENSYFGLMRLFDKLGNTTEVYNQYAKLSRMLEEDFGVVPDHTVSEWYSNWKDRKTS